MKVILIDGKKQYIDESKLSKALDKMHAKYYFSDIEFCPYYICYGEIVNGKLIYTVNNISIGYFNNIKSQNVDIIEVNTLRDFITEIYNLIFNKENHNKLF